MKPTAEFLDTAEKRIRLCLQDLRPKLLETHGLIEHKVKDDRSSVTEMDMLVEARLKKELEAIDPGIAFCGEETGGGYDHDTFWLVDPIDSTESFVRGFPFSTNMITLIDRNQTIMSIIYNFALDEYFLAIRGRGATKNGHPIRVSDRKMDRAVIIVSVNATKDRNAIGLMDGLKAKAYNILRMAGAGYEFAAVASGAADARVNFHGTGMLHDFAPGMLLVEEAGGRVGSIGSDQYDLHGKHPIAANTIIYDELKEFIEKYIADGQG